MLKKLLTAVVVVAGVSLYTAPKAEASFIAYICSVQNCTAGSVLTVSDEGGGDLATGVPGLIQMTGINFNGLTFVLNLAGSKPQGGSTPASPTMHLTAQATGQGSAYFYAVDNGWTGGLGFNANAGGALGPGASATAYACSGANTNTLPSQFSACAQGPVPSVFALANPGFAPYSLLVGALISHPTSTFSSVDFGLTSVPEPGSMMLLGTGLLGVANAVRRRRAAKN